MTTQEKVVGMVQEGRGVGGKPLGFLKRVSELLSLQQEWWKGRLVMPPCDLLKEQGQTHGLPFG